MTPQAQRIAIAESLGWIQRTEGMMWHDATHRAAIVQGSVLADVRRKMRLPMDNGVMLPDWLGDLNAIHAAVVALDEDLKWAWFSELAALVDPNVPAGTGSAGQWAEAYLRTTGRWNDAT